MKKALRIILKVAGIIVLVILLAAIIIPSLFKDQIREKVLSMANEKINAELAIGDFGITLFRNFPNLTFRLKDVSVTGVDRFSGDTLAGLKSFNLVFDIGSVLSKSGYRIRAIEIDRPVANAIILEDGTANYDIVPVGEELATETEVKGKEEIEEDDAAKESKLAFRLNKFEIKNAYISYEDLSSGRKALIDDLDLFLRGNMSAKQSNLLLETDIASVDFINDGIKMLNKATVQAVFDINADLENNKFVLGENNILINALQLLFSGSIELDGEDIITDMNIGTGNTEFKSVLSMVPAVYKKGFEGLNAGGSFNIEGLIKGRYSATDSLLPDINLTLDVNNGSIAYPDLPESIDNINIKADVSVNGTHPDLTVLDVAQFHFELDDNPFDMNLKLSTPLSDPAVDVALKGRIDFEALADAVPVELNELEGIFDIALGLQGKMSMIENQDYDSFNATGTMKLAGFKVEMKDLPPLEIEVADFNFSPRYAALEQFRMGVAGNNISLSGRLENYLPFIFKDETVKGKLDLYSDYIDLDTVMSYLPVDTVEVEEDTIALSTIRLPENVDFEFISAIDRFKYNPLEASGVKGNISLKEGVLLIKETGLSALGGEFTINAEYNSRDTINPRMAADLSVAGIGIQESFNTFNTVRQLAPVAKGMNGEVFVDFDLSTLLGKGMLPVVESINGSGRVRSEEIQLVSSPVFEKFSSVLQIGENYTNTFTDIDANFEVKDGRVYIKPFDTKLGDMNVTISGDHGLDQTINYLVKVEVPSSELPPGMSSVLTGLAARAALLGIEYYQPEIIKMKVRIGGTIKDPTITPFLGQSDDTSPVSSVTESLKEAAGEKIEEVKDQVSDEARKQADKMLAEAQKRADMIKAEATEAAEKLRKEADKNAQKLIDEAADKGALARLAAERAAEKLRKEADKKAAQLEEEAEKQADKIMEEASEKVDSLINK
ncbi:MAG: AsmA-like C-terminal region-containing protein [Bacteroidota bacterium]|nr:AsmA-like C-terminal region-containing protein [Bacteroidota bacterium]